jgi:hypothetical protein
VAVVLDLEVPESRLIRASGPRCRSGFMTLFMIFLVSVSQRGLAMAPDHEGESAPSGGDWRSGLRSGASGRAFESRPRYQSRRPAPSGQSTACAG